MAEPSRKAEISRKELFISQYKDVDRIWSGKSFLQYHDYKTLLADLPVSEVAVPSRQYRRKFSGNQEYVYGELVFALTAYEGYLRDKAFPLQECYIRPLLKANTFVLEFDIVYRTREGAEETRPAEVLRLGDNKYIFYVDHYRPM
jgi:hypothetical protein